MVERAQEDNKMNIDKAAMGMEKGIVSLASRLISIPTVNPPGENYEKIVDVLEKECRSLGLKTKRCRVPDKELMKLGIDPKYPRISLLAGWDTGAKRTLHIHGHYDVVPATSFWKTEPFRPIVKAGRIYGRGSYDMKGNIASAIYAVMVLKKLGTVPNVNVQLSFTPDEETGGRLGFKYIVDKGLVRADYAIDEGHSGHYVTYGNKGMLTFMIRVIGKSSHAAYSFNGINAFEYMSRLAVELEKLKKKVEKRTTRHKMSDPRQRHPTFVMGGILKGGSKSNTVPDSCTFSIDRRVLPDETLASAKNEILDVVKRFRKKNKKIRIIVKVTNQDRPVVVDKNSYFPKVFSRCIKKVYKKKAEFMLLSGGTDLRYLLFRSVPGLGHAAGGKNLHSDDEYVNIKSLVDNTRFLARLISELG